MNRRLLIGVIIADCHIEFQGEILRGIISQAFGSDSDTAVIAPLHDFSIQSVHKNAELRILDLIFSDRIDGLIYVRNSFNNENIRDSIDELCRRSEKPIMLLDQNEHKSFETTSVDDREAFVSITDHLINVHGIKNIFCLTGPKGTYSAEERLAGFKSSMRRHGLRADSSMYEYGDFWTEAPRVLAEKIINGTMPRPGAVVCGNDVMAITLTKALTDAGISVPGDIAVTGYDASVEGYQSTPSITSYSRPNFQLGAESFRRLYRMITGRECSHVPDESGELRIGESCGCHEDTALRREIQRDLSISSSLESGLLHGDMLFDITNADNIATFADRLDNYTYLLHKMRRLRILLTRSYIEATVDKNAEELTFRTGDDMKVVLAKSAVERETEEPDYFSSSELLPDYGMDRSYPSAFFFSPLHYNDNFFGYCAVSFGKEALSFSSLYLKWINYVNVALEQVRIKSIMNRTVLNTSKALLYDHVTGLLSRNGIQQEFVSRFAGGECEPVFMAIELQGLKNAVYRSDEEASAKITASFAKLLRSCCIRNKEICGAWSQGVLCVITADAGRTRQIFDELCGKIKDSRFGEGGESCDIDFTAAVKSIPVAPDMKLADVVSEAAVKSSFSYTVPEDDPNPQFAKLCILRNRIMKNPELPWNISEIADSLYLSKSYLQKIYKSYFGKSIIEEMIEFRIDHAKKLLSHTDMTVTEISRECGYSSYNYFVRQFRVSEGVSPSEYRSAQRKADKNEG